ncbi:MAG: sigma 54-interacting transcriptional regulator [Verrucomicrobiota bacterium]|jgi:formate hydrogenlyase transcriptional activator
MTATVNEFAASPGVDWAWKRPPAAAFEADKVNLATHQDTCDDTRRRDQPLDRPLLKSLAELILGLPALTHVEALRVWLQPARDHSVPLQLLLDDLPAPAHAALKLPLDDSVADWVWRHQRPLVIAAEAESFFPDYARRLLEWGVKYFCAVPLMLQDRRMGVLGFASTRREALDDFYLNFTSDGRTRVADASKSNGAAPDFPKIHERSRGAADRVYGGAPSEDCLAGIIGRSPAISALCQQIKIVAPTGSTVLILGETGTGKELFARAIHNLGPRRDRPFIKVNCAAIPAGLMESELFGHERGAFTGAVSQRIGRFEMADGGTLFLDEIGDIPLELQPKLLRVLQEQEFERIGSPQTTRVNVRIVAATSRDLPRMVTDREFRADLYYRLNIFPLRAPALRERPEDIPVLVRHFVQLFSSRTGRRVTEVPVETMNALLRCSWPGNVRELQNVIERAVILSPDKVLRAPLDELQSLAQPMDGLGAKENEHRTTLRAVEREHIVQALAATNWVLGGPKGAGARLGLARTTLIAKMQKLGISRAQA